MSNEQVELCLSKEIDEKYNHALSYFPPGDGTLVGNEDKIRALEDVMNNPTRPTAVILGEAGIGKTALVEQLAFLHKSTKIQYVFVRLGIEILGALPENIMVSRMSTLLTDMKQIKADTEKNNPGKKFKLILFVDEIHKLNKYGAKEGSASSALNALKESLGRGIFPIISATTSKEYQDNVAIDDAMDRRFNKVILKPPTLEVTKAIIKKHLNFLDENIYVPPISEKSLNELIELTDAYVHNQVDPAKSLTVIDSAIGHETTDYNLTGVEKPIDHVTFKHVFDQDGYNIDPPASAKEVRDEIHSRVKGQPLAVKLIGDAINNAFLAPRDRKKPLFTALLVGTTGTGKTETAKSLAKALFGRDDAILTINGGDYPTAEDAKEVQLVIGDDMASNKQKVILLDEFEKSHKTVQFSLMRMLDEGIVRDSHGSERSINNTVVIATSNLGAKMFNDLGKALKLGRNEHPDKFDQNQYDEYVSRRQDVIRKLVEGDVGQNNGIKPEILQRFQAIIPYFPLPKSIFGLITMLKIQKLKQEWSKPGSIYALGDIGIKLLTPKVKSPEWWEKATGNKQYVGLDPLSAMIAGDMVNAQADQEGARAIDEIIKNNLISKVTQEISDRTDKNLRVDSNTGAFVIDTNGQAFFEDSGLKRADITVKFKTLEELR